MTYLSTVSAQIPLRKIRFRRPAAAALEFAIVAPVLFILLFGIIEFGRLMMVQEVLNNAAREGCRTAVLAGSTTTDVNNTVNTYLTNSGITGGTVTVSPAPDSAAPGTAITVTVSVPFNSVSWLPSPMWLGGKTLNAAATMRKESNS